MMTAILNIATRSAKRQPMVLLDSALVTCEFGVENDFRGKPGKRQVTVLDNKSWQEACNILGKKIEWQTRRANILVSDLNLENTAGCYLLMGELVLQITQETDPCKRMEEYEPGLFNALKDHWRGGVCCQVIREGKIKIGDKVKLITKEEYETEKQRK